MKDYEKFYSEVEEVWAEVSALVNVLKLYYNVSLYSVNGGELGKSSEFCDWLYIINRYADEVMEESQEILKRNL